MERSEILVRDSGRDFERRDFCGRVWNSRDRALAQGLRTGTLAQAEGRCSRSAAGTALSVSLKYTGMKPPELGAGTSRSNACFENGTMTKPETKQLVVSVNNDGHPASLEKRKIYVALRDAAAENLGRLGVVDESGEDYLYPRSFCRAIALPQAVSRAVLAAAY